MVLVNDRHIHGRGTPEATWQAWPGLNASPELPLDSLVPPGSRAVVVAPHPDDEVLGAGGLLALLAAQQSPVLIFAVTDGEACHPPTAERPAAAWADQRRAEAATAWHRLGLPAGVGEAIGIADGQVAAHEALLADHLADRLSGSDTLFCPWRLDGHPDHEATGRACAQAAARCGCQLVELPVWMWHWAAPGDARVPWHRLRRLPLSLAAQQAKQAALAAHRSQLDAGPQGEPPILPGWATERLLRADEFVLTAA